MALDSYAHLPPHPFSGPLPGPLPARWIDHLKANGVTVELIGETANGLPLHGLSVGPADAPTLSVVAGAHPDEPAGPLAACHIALEWQTHPLGQQLRLVCVPQLDVDGTVAQRDWLQPWTNTRRSSAVRIPSSSPTAWRRSRIRMAWSSLGRVCAAGVCSGGSLSRPTRSTNRAPEPARHGGSRRRLVSARCRQSCSARVVAHLL